MVIGYLLTVQNEIMRFLLENPYLCVILPHKLYLFFRMDQQFIVGPVYFAC